MENKNKFQFSSILCVEKKNIISKSMQIDII